MQQVTLQVSGGKLIRNGPCSLQVSIHLCPWPRRASRQYLPVRDGRQVVHRWLSWVTISLTDYKLCLARCSSGAKWSHRTPSVCRRHPDTSRAWLRWRSATRASNSAKDLQGDLSMSVSTFDNSRKLTTHLPVIFYPHNSLERTDHWLWIPAAPEVNTEASGRSGKATQRDYPEASGRFSRGSVLNAKVSTCRRLTRVIPLSDDLIPPRSSPSGATGFNSYTGQLAVSVQDGNTGAAVGQWTEGKFWSYNGIYRNHTLITIAIDFRWLPKRHQQ